MGITIIGPTAQQFPSQAIPAMVELKRAWTDPWTFVPELEFLGGNLATTAHDLGSAVFLHRYGILKHPWEPADSKKSPASLAGCWVRVLLAGQQGFQEAWIGQITGEGRDVFGSTQTNNGLIPAGAQHFEALGPLQILRKIHVSSSHWRVDDANVEICWVPSLNEKYGRTDTPGSTQGRSLGTGPGAKALGSRSGNRYENVIETAKGYTYLYGGTELWDYYQYAWYVLRMFVDESATGGPHWKLGGAADLLKNFADPIQFGTTQTVDHILRALIRPEFGLDYQIVPTDDGFEVSVFVLTKESCGWGGETLPGNPDTVKIYSSRSKDNVQTRVAKTTAQRYGTIRILGSRIVVCCSLFADEEVGTLKGKWQAADREDYYAGTGSLGDTAEKHDRWRQRERFRDVLRRYGAPADWDFGSGLIEPQDFAAVQWDGQGQPIDSPAAFQRTTRSTLPWLPLQTGVDYSQNPPVDHNTDLTITPVLRLPQVWLNNGEDSVFAPADREQIHISVLSDDLGVFLHAAPNHLLAKGVWDSYNPAPTEHQPLWDPRTLIATLAFYTDQRVYCEQAIEGAVPGDGVLEIDASECQLWWLAKDTMVDVDAAGEPVLAPAGVIVRNDYRRMMAKMAGALARHYQERARAQIVVKGLLPWGGLLGQILTVIDEGGDTQTIGAPITEIRWTNGDNPTTVISTGFAAGD